MLRTRPHIAIITPPLRGHLDPMTALGEALQARGHRISLVVDDPDARVPRSLDVIALPPSQAAPFADAIASRLGPIGVARAMARRIEHLCDVLPELLCKAEVDALLVDQVEASGALVARRLGLPYASIACALPLNTEEGLPPPYVDWPYRTDPAGMRMTRGGHRVTGWLMAPVSRAIRWQAGTWGLSGLGSLEDTFSERLQILQLVAGLDFPRRSLPVTAHYVGPLRSDETGSFDTPSDGRPLAFCSLGTLKGGQLALLRQFAEAASGAGLRPVIAHGGRLTAEQAAGLPGNPIVASFLPQRAVLARSALALIHGGMNTTLDALAAGVPLVVVPLAYEQGAIAARVVHAGVGAMVKPGRAAKDLPDVVAAVLRDPDIRRRAQQLGAEIANAGGRARAADLIENMLLPATGPSLHPDGADHFASEPSRQGHVPLHDSAAASARGRIDGADNDDG